MTTEAAIPSLPFYPPLVPGEPVPVPSPTQQALDRVFYPETDGKPIAENTQQFKWIEVFKGGLDALLAGNPAVFVAADLLWYPAEGTPHRCVAPDVMVVFGRPKGDRGSYLQWREEGIAPQVVVEILSPSNTPEEMEAKLAFYSRYGVQEYFEYNPSAQVFRAWVRENETLTPVENAIGWTSPILGVRFERDAEGEILVIRPDGRAFATYVELDRQREEADRLRLIAEEQREAAEQQRDEAQQRAERLAARLREMSIDPDAVNE